MNKPKILFLVQLPPPVHGASMVNKSLVVSKKINNVFDIDVLPLSFVKNIDDIGKASAIKIWYLIKIIFKLLKALTSKKFDLFYFTISPIGYALYRDLIFVFILKTFNKKIVYHLHGKGIQSNASKSKLKSFLYSWAFKNTYVITLSKGLNKDIEAVYSGTPYSVNNGIEQLDLSTFKNKENNPIVFVYLSNLVLSKGIKVFLDAIVLTYKSGYDFRVKIIGNSADFSIEQVKSFVKHHALQDNISVLGPKYNQDKFEELATSDVFVFPTQNDCFPLSILEAMQMKLPVISTTQGAIPDIIENNKNGIIVREQNVGDVSDAMVKYIENRELIEVHGANNLKKFKQCFTNEIFEDTFVEVINEILLK